MTISTLQACLQKWSRDCASECLQSIDVFFYLYGSVQSACSMTGQTLSKVCRVLVLMLITVTSAACVAPAYKKIDESADKYGFARSTLQSDTFRHVIYAPERNAVGNTVHVYIEGDGVAWQWRYFIKSDPTPRAALMLNLMRLDKANTLYIGRPCYFGMVLDEECNADYWTFSRFSEKVVNSMVDVIAQRTARYKNVVLLGHSGGGALALLVAEKLPKVTAVVTVAGNIDTDAWTAHHKYTRLYGSINPALQAPLPLTIKQLHLVGGKDEVIPPRLTKSWVLNQPTAILREVPINTHLCCWENQWPEVLNWLARIEHETSAVSARLLH